MSCDVSQQNRKILKYKTLQPYIPIIEKIYNLLNHPYTYISHYYEYYKIKKFYTFVVSITPNIKILDDTILFMLFSYLVIYI